MRDSPADMRFSVILGEDDRESLEMHEFDLDRYLRASKRVDLSGVTWERVQPPDLRVRGALPRVHDGHRDPHLDLPPGSARDAGGL
jgi:hypothetical protein